MLNEREIMINTNDGWVLTESMFAEIKEICPSLNETEILRMVDMMVPLGSKMAREWLTSTEEFGSMYAD